MMAQLPVRRPPTWRHSPRRLLTRCQGKKSPTPVFLIRTLVPSHQPPVTVAALTAFICAQACAGTHRTFGPVLRVCAPGNSSAAGHPAGIGYCAHDGFFDRTGVGPAASHAPGVRTEFPANIVSYHIVNVSCRIGYPTPRMSKVLY